MGEKELEVTSPEQYVKLTHKNVRVRSGAVFRIKALNAESMVELLKMLPEEGFSERSGVIGFVKDKFDVLLDKVIYPNIVAPKLEKSVITFMDVVDLLLTEMEISGLGETDVDDDEGFQNKSNDPDS